jgi:hypothetical protein
VRAGERETERREVLEQLGLQELRNVSFRTRIGACDGTLRSAEPKKASRCVPASSRVSSGSSDVRAIECRWHGVGRPLVAEPFARVSPVSLLIAVA